MTDDGIDQYDKDSARAWIARWVSYSIEREWKKTNTDYDYEPRFENYFKLDDFIKELLNIKESWLMVDTMITRCPVDPPKSTGDDSK